MLCLLFTNSIVYTINGTKLVRCVYVYSFIVRDRVCIRVNITQLIFIFPFYFFLLGLIFSPGAYNSSTTDPPCHHISRFTSRFDLHLLQLVSNSFCLFPEPSFWSRSELTLSTCWKKWGLPEVDPTGTLF